MLAIVLLLAPASFAAFPGANGRVAFVLGGPFGPGSPILTTDLAGGLVFVTTGYDADPAWSPDGERLAFSREPPRGTFIGEIFTVNADGSGLRQVTAFSGSDRSDENPSWSPDGEKLVFQSGRVIGGVQNTDVYVIGPDGSGEVRLTDDPATDQTPAWSPDGRSIAFASSRGPVGSTGLPNTDIYVMSADGGGDPVRLTRGHNSYPDLELSYEPNWSPDGKRLAITRGSCFLGSPPSCSTDIFLIDADGGNERRLTTNPLNDLHPAWSPDGSKIIFEREAPTEVFGPLPDLFTIDPDGANLRRGTSTDTFSEHDPDWQPLSRPPICGQVTAEPTRLLPANRRFVAVELVGLTDPDGDVPTLTIGAVTQDESVTDRGDPSAPDARIVGGALELRAERSPHGDGRVYRIGFTGSDGNGGTCSGEVTVSVPRHRDTSAVDSAPPSYDSFRP